MDKIIVRVDDVMCESSAWDRPRSIRRITAFQRWMSDIPAIEYVPTVLVTEIQDYSEVIELLRAGAQSKIASPQIHGLEHIDYGALDEATVRSHLKKCIEWFERELDFTPTVWATPWGGTNDIMQRVSAELGLRLETTHPTIDVKKAMGYLKSGQMEVKDFFGKTILEHWWNRGSTLLRFVDCVRYGSYTEAVKQDRLTRKDTIF